MRWLRLNKDGMTKLLRTILKKEDVECTPEVAKVIVEQLLELKPKEAAAVSLRFGLRDGQRLTQEVVGKTLGVSKQWVSQLEGCAMRKLRHPSRSGKLKQALEVKGEV